MQNIKVLLCAGLILFAAVILNSAIFFNIIFVSLRLLFVAVLGLSLLAFSPFSLPFQELPKEKPRRGLLNERFSNEKVHHDGGNKYDAIVIGSGMGGLTCAASLSRFGYRVIVLEQHEVAGGGTHTFFIDGKTDYEFDSGLHYTVPQSAELLQLACGTRNKPVEVSKISCIFYLLTLASSGTATYQ